MFSHWAYILLGNDKTGKTSFQKHLIEVLCNRTYTSLPINTCTEITHQEMPRKIKNLFCMNRSFQEMRDKYENVDEFFEGGFEEASICILSSHVTKGSLNELSSMIDNLHRNVFNVAGVFFSNGFKSDTESVAMLDWDERLWIDNPRVKPDEIEPQIARLAKEFAELLISRSRLL